MHGFWSGSDKGVRKKGERRRTIPQGLKPGLYWGRLRHD
jgi:hypothetical protein